MRRLFLAAALFLAVPAPADQRLTCGTVEALEITSLTKARLTSFLRTVLPEAPPGSKIFFEGKIDLANTVLPVGPRMTALAQHAEGRHEVVFLVDVELAKLPPELVSRLNANALDLTLEGNLRSSDSSSGVSPVPVCAAGVLKIGTPEIRSARAIASRGSCPWNWRSMPLCTNHRRAFIRRMVSPRTQKRKWPGSMIPAWTGPTGISYT